MLFLFFYTPGICFSQDHLPISDPKLYLQEKRILDSLLLCKPAMIEDSNWVNHLIKLGVSYCFFSFDSALLHAEKALVLAEKSNNPDQVARSYLLYTIIYDHAKDHPRIEWLKHKTFIVSHSFTDAEVKDKKFLKKIIEASKAMKPLNEFLKDAIV